MIQYSMVDSLILLDARREVGVIGGVIRVSRAGMFSVLGSQFSGRSQTGESRRFMKVSSASEAMRSKRKAGTTGGTGCTGGNPEVSVLKRLSRRGAGKKMRG